VALKAFQRQVVNLKTVVEITSPTRLDVSIDGIISITQVEQHQQMKQLISGE